MNNFTSIKLKIASPEDITQWSYGEVIKPETINYRTQRPEKDGLFSERIFGPTKDWECYCGKYRRIRYKGVVCDKCGVEVTRANVRRERMGHISLAAPVAHIWFLRNMPSYLSLMIDIPMQKLEKVIYYSAYVVIRVNEENKKRAIEEVEREFKARKKTEEKDKLEDLTAATKQLLSDLESLVPGRIMAEGEYHNLARRFGDVFEAGGGAEAIRKVLEMMDLEKEIKELEKEIATSSETLTEKKLVRRLKLLHSMRKNNLRPEWMIMTVLPVIPPDLRPMVPLDGGRYATSDQNDLYRRVINRNNRLKKLLELKAPEVIIINEKRMLQEAVDALIDNSARFGTQQLSRLRRPLRSLADMLKGKQGRFRQNLLGKRVDYSGRSVIVIGPKLRIGECGLPKKMALELFRPFVISRIIRDGLAHNIKNANRLIEQAPPEVWAILEEVIKDKRVLLNRAPTLHRLSVQAFKPHLIEGLALQIPALVCTAFNADFDGDQMAVHVPLSDEAQKEASELMSSGKNILKPATGDPITVPILDIVLGGHYLTKIDPDGKGAGKVFADDVEALAAYQHDYVAINAPVKVASVSKEETSCGRVIFNQALPKDFGFVNETQTKKSLTSLVKQVFNRYGFEKTEEVLNNFKDLGFEYATISGITWSMGDLKTPKEKTELLEKAEVEIARVQEQYETGMLTNKERKARVISIWDSVKSSISKIVPQTLSSKNPVYMIIDSGARASWSTATQMMGMRGLVANPKGEIIEMPIKGSLREGLSVLEYFISTHGARKGLTDTALKTAQAGYLTRRLVDVAQDVTIREDDCGAKEGIDIFRKDGEAFGQSFASRVFSRTALEDIKVDRKIVVRAGESIDQEAADAIKESDLQSIQVRSPITCKTLYGICAKCYGLDLSTNELVRQGEAVGIIAAQSIGEPGTQLTLRTFHTGGVAGLDITHGLPRIEELFEVRPPKGKALLVEEDGTVEKIEDRGPLRVVVIKAEGKKGKATEYAVPRSTAILVKTGDKVLKGYQVTEGSVDPKELLEHRGARDVERYITNEVQRIYMSEAAPINNKHIEIIIRQMFARIKVKESGDTDFVIGEILEKSKFLEVNREIKKQGGQPAKASQLLLGITRVSLSTESFLSAASFQETSRVLVKAASEGRVDKLRGLKENVIIGRLIPVGTGLRSARELEIEQKEKVDGGE